MILHLLFVASSREESWVLQLDHHISLIVTNTWKSWQMWIYIYLVKKTIKFCHNCSYNPHPPLQHSCLHNFSLPPHPYWKTCLSPCASFSSCAVCCECLTQRGRVDSLAPHQTPSHMHWDSWVKEHYMQKCSMHPCWMSHLTLETPTHTTHHFTQSLGHNITQLNKPPHTGDPTHHPPLYTHSEVTISPSCMSQPCCLKKRNH